MNCKYNAAYDVQRLNTRSASGKAGLRTRGEGEKEERFAFTKDNPDLVAYEMALRTELHMRMVMPAIVPHSEAWPYMAMARFETGPGGNPHYHGFSMGDPGPVVKRVKADVAGGDDLPPRTMTDDMRVVRRAMLDEGGPLRWEYGETWARVKFLEEVEKLLVTEDQAHRIEGDEAGHVIHGEDEVPVEDFAKGRVLAVLKDLLDTGVLTELPGEGEGETSDVRYALAPPVPSGVPAERKGWRWGDRQARLDGDVVDLGILKPEEEEQQLQSSLEKQFAEFFEGIVSEWNPCYTEDGRWRYKWDTEIGAHDVDVDLDPLDEVELDDAEREAFVARDKDRSTEAKAVREVNAREPDRVNLRGLLDKVFAVEDAVDVQRVRRLVAALVNRVARHTKHGHQAPTLGVHACARGKEGCPVCRYGFPRDRLPRDPNGKRRMAMERGALEGQWHAKFPRNDRLCCSYEAHVLLANMGNVDWRPVLNLWAVVQYVTKYATKAPKGARRVLDVLKDAVDEVCHYVPEGDGSDLLRRAIQKFFARTLGERDYHLYEAIHLGLQLPLVIPMMPVISLNTSGASPVKPWTALIGRYKEDAPVHYDSRVAKFDKRRELVRLQLARGDESVKPREVEHVSLYEFWWKYTVYKGCVRRSTRPVCLMVTPSFGADCANVEHTIHEGYARTAVIAYWRHMPTEVRREKIEQVLASGEVKAEADVCVGATPFADPSPAESRHLGVLDLYMKFEGYCEG